MKGGDGNQMGIPRFGEFGLEEPRAVTTGFFPDYITFEHGEEVSNVIHCGQLPDSDRFVVIKLQQVLLA